MKLHGTDVAALIVKSFHKSIIGVGSCMKSAGQFVNTLVVITVYRQAVRLK